MALRLIYEETWQDNSAEIITEENGKKSFYVVSPFGIQAETKNRNGRIYPMSVMEPEINRYLKEVVETGGAFGELGHPEGQKGAKLNEERISHRFTEIKRNASEPNYFSLKAKLLETPLGNLAKAVIDGGGKLGISTRCLGSVVSESKGTQVVGPDLFIVTAGDIVVTPSAQRAFVAGIYEGAEYSFVDGMLVEAVINMIDKGYKEMASQEEKQKALLEGFKTLMKHLKNEDVGGIKDYYKKKGKSQADRYVASKQNNSEHKNHLRERINEIEKEIDSDITDSRRDELDAQLEKLEQELSETK